MVELRHRLQSLPPAVVEETLSEVQGHLACSQAALMELGDDPVSSDRESVRRFGDVTAFARHVIQSHRGQPIVCPWVPAVSLAAILYTLGMAILMIYDRPALWAPPVIAIPLFLAFSWRARDFQWKGLCRAGLVGMVVAGATIGLTWVDLWSSGGMGEVPRWQMSRYLRSTRDEISNYPGMIAACDEASQVFLGGKDAAEASRYFDNGRYLAYEFQFGGDGIIPAYRPHWVTDFETASWSWSQYRSRARLDWRDAYLRAQQNLSAIQEAPQICFHLKPAGEGVAAAGVLSFAALILNFLVVVLRGIVERTSSGPRRTVA